MDDPLYGLTASAGLHVLKDNWGQKDYLEAQCRELATNLAIAVRKTAEEAPERQRPYFEGFRGEREPKLGESKWEDALWRWSKKGNETAVVGCWQQIVSYQVPLFAKQKKDKWGYIDLLAIDSDGTLAVLELKKEPSINAEGRTKSSESPLRMILEAAAYAVALRHNWKTFHSQLLDHLTRTSIDSGIVSKLPAQLSTVRLLGVAPTAYWADWLPVTAKGCEVKPATWEAFRRLLDALQKEGLPTSFVSLSGNPMRPLNLKVRLLRGFPLG